MDNRVCCLAVLVLAVVAVAAGLFSVYAFSSDGGDYEHNTEHTTTIKPTKPSLKDSANYRLPRTLRPRQYVVKLQPFINGEFNVSGFVEVRLQVVEATRNITIHMADIITHNDTIRVWVTDPEGEGDGKVEEEVVVSKHEYDPERQWYVARLDRKLHVNQTVVLSMNFTGLLNDQLRGFYRSSYTGPDGNTVWMASTHFQPTEARRAFPCMDEPALKAKFTVSLAREMHMTSLSNMPLLETKPMDSSPGWVWDHYNTSMEMSTYLVAFIVSNFENVTKTMESGTVFSVWARPEATDQLQHALEVGMTTLAFFEQYFSLSIPLPKQDMIAIPDFAGIAMENWGLIIFSEIAMLCDPRYAANKMFVSQVVVHEVVHLWFGSLVTPSWWTYLWLSEGFASFMEGVVLGEVAPSLKKEHLAVVESLQMVFHVDSLESSHPITMTVGHRNEIKGIFDAISYGKGSSIIRMMNYLLTEDTFRRALTNYLSHFAYDVATQDDLWEYLTEAAKEDNKLPGDASIKDIMDTWTLQMGYPVVTVTRSADGSTATLAQERFLLLGNSKKQQEYSWWIPLSYTTADAPDFSQTQPRQWMKAGEVTREVVGLPAKEHWVIYNVQETGYFRVNYDDDNWIRISEQLQKNHEVIHVVNRAQLMDDALNMARSGRLSYSKALGMTFYLVREREYIPWMAAFNAFTYLQMMMIRTSGYEALRTYLLGLLKPVYESSWYSHMRAAAMHWTCTLGHEDCVEKAMRRFTYWLSGWIATTDHSAMCIGLAAGGEAEWNIVWRRYEQSTMAEEKTALLLALGCTKHTQLLSRYLEMAFTEASGVRKQDAKTVFTAVAEKEAGRDLAWRYLRDNWDHISNYLGALDTLGSMITSVTQWCNTIDEQKEIMRFYEAHKGQFGTAETAIKQAIETAGYNVAWMETHFQDVWNWLDKEGRMIANWARFA